MPPPPEWTRAGDEETGTLAVRSEPLDNRCLVRVSLGPLAVTARLTMREAKEIALALVEAAALTTDDE